MSRITDNLDAELDPAIDAAVAAWVGKSSATLTALKALAAEKVGAVNTVAASGATQTLPDVTTAVVHDITLTAACTFTFPANPAGKVIVVRLTQDGTGSRLATWPASVAWAAATAPTLSTAAAKADVFRFTGIGTKWIGQTVALDAR